MSTLHGMDAVQLANRNLRNFFRALDKFAIATGSGIAAIILLGYLLHVDDHMENFLPGVAIMKLNTALALLICGIAMAMKIQGAESKQWTGWAIAGAAVAMAFAVAGLIKPERMSSTSATCIFCIGLAIIFLDAAPALSQLFSYISLALSILALLGFLYGVSSPHSASIQTPIALHTAASVALLSLGVMLAQPKVGLARMMVSNSAGGATVRRLLPAVILVPPIIGWLRLQGQFRGYYNAELGMAIFSESAGIALLAVVYFNASVLDRAQAKHFEIESDWNDLLTREKAARQEAEKAILARDQLLSIVSHELRTPLTPILLTVSGLQDRDDLSAELRQDLVMIREQIRTESRMIGDLLDLVSLNQGKTSLEQAPLDLHEVTRKMIGRFDELFQQKRVTLNVQLTAESHTVLGDAARLGQIISNLLSNALKFTPSGGSATIQSRNSSNHQIELQVIDTGIGIEPQFMTRMFGAFEQREVSLSRHFGGLGVGLSICKLLIDLHGWAIEPASEGLGKGSRFTIRLPTILAEIRQQIVPQANVA